MIQVQTMNKVTFSFFEVPSVVTLFAFTYYKVCNNKSCFPLVSPPHHIFKQYVVRQPMNTRSRQCLCCITTRTVSAVSKYGTVAVMDDPSPSSY